MSEFLSQDDIDGLLQQGGEEIFDAKDVGDDLSVEESGPDYNALTSAFELFCEQIGSVLSKVLNKTVTFSVSQCEAINQETAQNSVTAPVLSLAIPFEEGLTGTAHCIIGTKDVAALSDFMMMGDGSAEYAEEHKDAISELFNQMLGAFTTAFGEKFGISVSSGTLEVAEFDFASPSVPLENCDMVILGMNIAEFSESSICMILPQELSTQFMDKFRETQKMDGDLSDLSASEFGELSEIAGIGESDSFGESGFGGSGGGAPGDANINMLLDVEMDVAIELGRTDLSIKRILELAPGSIVELDRMAGEPVDLVVNEKVVARGEVVVVDENFGIRIVSLVSPEDRIKSLR